MMNNKKAKIILNGAVLAVMAALGITVYQIGTSSSKEEIMYEDVKEKAEKEYDTESGISGERKENKEEAKGKHGKKYEYQRDRRNKERISG